MHRPKFNATTQSAARGTEPGDSHWVAVAVPALLGWFHRHARDLPWRRRHDPYAIWVAEIMLQQTQVASVIPYWERFIKAVPNLRRLADLPEPALLKLWEGLGYYSRARNLQRAAREVLRTYRGVFPREFEAVLALPGIGRYTAGAICSIAYGLPTPVLDGNVVRVLTRLAGIRGDVRKARTRERLWSLAEALVAQAVDWKPTAGLGSASPGARGSTCGNLNQALMELGSTVCTPRSPHCARCPVGAICFAHREGMVSRLPQVPKRAKTHVRLLAAFIHCRKSKVFIRRRRRGAINGNLWEFPHEEFSKLGSDQVGQYAAEGWKAIGEVQAMITNNKFRVQLYLKAANGVNGQRMGHGKWVAWRELRLLPFAGPDRKILRVLDSLGFSWRGRAGVKCANPS